MGGVCAGEETMATILLVDDEPLQASFLKSALERYFDDVQRVPDAAEALCMVEQPGFAGKLGLVIAGHHAAGFGGPAFVHELQDRLPALNVVVIGNDGESSTDYAGNKVYFLPNQSEVEELAAISGFLLEVGARAA
jgi:DNA-binding NtrC family response regulator